MRARVEETTTPAAATSAAPRTLARLLPPPRPAIDKDVLAFRTSLFAPRRNFEPSSGKGRFDALLLPGPGVMQITVRVRFNFISGRQAGDDPFPGIQGTDPSEFQWDPGAELAYKTRFLTEIAPQWSRRFAFESTRSPHEAWKDVTITPIVRIVEDELTPHVVLDVHKRPDDVEPVTNTVSPRDPNKPGQPLTTYFTSDNLGLEAPLDDPLNEKSIKVTKVHFKRGRTELDERGNSELAPIVTQMSAHPKSHATLRGRASSDRKAGTTVQEGFKLNLRLSRERSRAVADALEAAGIKAERILIRNWGDSGATFDEDNCRVDVAVGSHQARQQAAHEFGHIFGLGDEYGYSDIPGARPGDPLNDPAYEKMVKDQTGYDLRRTSDESMMSKGATIRPWHYSPFLEALKAIAGPSWKLR
jgi:outer membrane protein OmpA-like peptidoglycan-associated protein